MGKYYLLIDIDGTLSDASKRAEKYLSGEKPDWDGFYNACGEDDAFFSVTSIVDTLSKTYDIVFCTGRRKSCDAATREWLKKYVPNCADAPILYRENGDERHDIIVKPELLDAYMRENDKGWPLAIFEDRNSMVAKWREMGLIVFQPAEGNF